MDGQGFMSTPDIESRFTMIYRRKIDARIIRITLSRLEKQGYVSRAKKERMSKWPGRPASTWQITPSGITIIRFFRNTTPAR
jgi:predicted ArsR family transcriptional regulator